MLLAARSCADGLILHFDSRCEIGEPRLERLGDLADGIPAWHGLSQLQPTNTAGRDAGFGCDGFLTQAARDSQSADYNG